MSEHAADGSVRLFVAMFPEPQGLPERLRFLGKEKAAIPEENQHVTVLFIGEFPEARLGKAMNILRSVARKHSRFILRFDSFAAARGRKPEKGHLWAKYLPNPELQRIHDALADTMSVHGSRGRVTPHVTLSRLGKATFRKAQTAIGEIEGRGPDLPFDHLAMVRSTLTPNGSVYAKLGVEPLPAAAP